jgi:hypothetical protein
MSRLDYIEERVARRYLEQPFPEGVRTESDQVSQL